MTQLNPDVLKKWWWLLALLVGMIGYWGYIPKRLDAAEEAIEDLKDWAKELQGYTRAIEEQKQQSQQSQSVQQPVKYTVPNIPSYNEVPDRLPIQEFRDNNGYWWCCDPNFYRCSESWDYWYAC